MPVLSINGISVTVDDGATILTAAASVSVEIPTLCHMPGLPPQTSCMICVVKDRVTGQMIPACSARAAEGMQIETECDEVKAARRDILNLLLSEHVGDCEAPCTRICPAGLDIPHMLREIAKGRMESAGWIARRDLAIPMVLSHVCPAPCEKGCRRGQLDSPITIRKLHGDVPREDLSGRLPELKAGACKVAVSGSGAAGLACAWQLRLLGFEVTVFDDGAEFGGALRELEKLPREILDAEIDVLRSQGILFDPVMQRDSCGLPVVEPEEHKLVVKAVANGKAAARRFADELNGESATESFDSRIGRLRESEVEQLGGNCSAIPDASPASQREAARCLHCDCRKPVSCRLRRYAAQYGADASVYPADERGHVQLIGGGSVLFEPGKCIKCGLCVEITRRDEDAAGMAFMGRGIATKVQIPFGESLDAGLMQTAAVCVEQCPTGALAFRDAEER
ncbi:MAG: (2Fe-2S)-binding protein [Pontiellaceae bacterium]|nr:(2Fe-2S)-binding protein [Pontiellaceae bacterium]MBN2784700.1 (2Fe-2S)-binding protein [Pontiellaceae bacterium]